MANTRRSSSGRHPSSSSANAAKNYESTVRGIQGLNFDGDDRNNNY
jgi:casein kinase 1